MSCKVQGPSPPPREGHLTCWKHSDEWEALGPELDSSAGPVFKTRSHKAWLLCMIRLGFIALRTPAQRRFGGGGGLVFDRVWALDR